MRRMGVDPPQAERAAGARRPDPAAGRGRPPSTSTAACSEYAVDLVLATRDPARHGLADLAPFIAYGRVVPGQPRPGGRRPGAGAAAAPLATCCPRTSSTSPPTCCATGWCCPTRPWPRGRGQPDPGPLLATVPAPRLTPDAGPPRPAPCRPRPPRAGHGDGRHLAGRHDDARGRRPAPAWPAARAPRSPRPPAPAEVLRRLELTLSRRLDGLLHGDYRGLVPGHGTEAGETRRYDAGDDVRRIDWNVTARMQVPHVRETIADRELETWLLVDLSPSPTSAPPAAPSATWSSLPPGRWRSSPPGPATGSGRHVLTGRGRRHVPARGPGRPRPGAARRAGGRSPRPTGPAARRPPAPDIGDALDLLARATRRRGLAVGRSPTSPATGEWIPGAAVRRRPPRDAGHRGRRPPRAGAARRRPAGRRRPRDRPASARSTPATPGSAAATPTRPGPARRHGRHAPGPGVDHLVLRTDRDGTADLVGWLVAPPAGASPTCAASTALGAAREVGHEVPRRLAAVPAASAWPPWPAPGWRCRCSAAAHVVRFTNVDLLDVVAPREPGWRRHVPAVLFLVALAALVARLRPRRCGPCRCGDERATVVLAIDTSLSMEADRRRAQPARGRPGGSPRLRRDLPEQLNVGLVAFNGIARSRSPPPRTATRWPRPSTRLELGEGTAIGEAIFTSLDAIEAAPAGEDDEPAPARIVVMSDGETTVGRANAEARGRRRRGRRPGRHDRLRHPGRHDRGRGRRPRAGPRGARARWPRSPATTGGTAFEADSLGELGAAYADIGGVVGYDEVDRDVSGWFVGAGIACCSPAGRRALSRCAWSPAPAVTGVHRGSAGVDR